MYLSSFSESLFNLKGVSVMNRLIAFVTVAMLSGSVFGQEWTRFRGPNGTGIGDARKIPTSWTDADYNWRIKLPAGGHGSPVLWGKKLFTTCADDDNADQYVLCVDSDTGKILWQKKYSTSVWKPHKFNAFSSSSPVVDDAMVYVVWSTKESHVLTALTHGGKQVWQRDFGEFFSEHGNGTSPILFEDLLIIGNDQKGDGASLVAVDKHTGKTRWSVKRKGGHKTAYGTPVIYRPKGQAPQVVFNAHAHGMTSLDPRTGQVNWEKPGIFIKRTVFSPIVYKDLILGSCGSGSRGDWVVAVRAPGAKGGEPEVAYKIEKFAPYVPTPVIVDGLMFLIHDTGRVTCVDAGTGEQKWADRLRGNFFGSPVCVNGVIYCISRDGRMFILRASDKFELLNTVSLGEQSHSTPAVANDRMFIRTYNHLMSLGG